MALNFLKTIKLVSSKKSSDNERLLETNDGLSSIVPRDQTPIARTAPVTPLNATTPIVALVRSESDPGSSHGTDSPKFASNRDDDRGNQESNNSPVATVITTTATTASTTATTTPVESPNRQKSGEMVEALSFLTSISLSRTDLPKPSKTSGKNFGFNVGSSKHHHKLVARPNSVPTMVFTTPVVMNTGHPSASALASSARVRTSSDGRKKHVRPKSMLPNCSKIVKRPKRRQVTSMTPTTAMSSTVAMNSSNTLEEPGFVTCSEGGPFAVFSVIGYAEESESSSEEEPTVIEKAKIQIIENDFADLLHPTEPSSPSDNIGDAARDTDLTDPQERPYDPYFLDNPEIKMRNHTIIKPPGIVISVLPFVNASKLESDMDQLFTSKHQWLEAPLSLTQIRKTKRKIVQVIVSLELELATASLAHFLFENLILKNAVTMQNMNVFAGVALVLGIKFNEAVKSSREMDLALLDNDPKHIEDKVRTEKYCHLCFARGKQLVPLVLHQWTPAHVAIVCKTCLKVAKQNPERLFGVPKDSLKTLSVVLETIEEVMGVPKKQLLSEEFCVWVLLKFSLHAPFDTFAPHLQRILASQESSLHDFFDDLPAEAKTDWQLEREILKKDSLFPSL